MKFRSKMSFEFHPVNRSAKTATITGFNMANVDFRMASMRNSTTEGTTFPIQTKDEIKKLTMKFITENKTIFEELAKL